MYICICILLQSYPSHHLGKVSKISPSRPSQSMSRLLRNTSTDSTAAGSSKDKKSLSSKRYRVKTQLVIDRSLDSALAL